MPKYRPVCTHDGCAKKGYPHQGTFRCWNHGGGYACIVCSTVGIRRRAASGKLCVVHKKAAENVKTIDAGSGTAARSESLAESPATGFGTLAAATRDATDEDVRSGGTPAEAPATGGGTHAAAMRDATDEDVRIGGTPAEAPATGFGTLAAAMRDVADEDTRSGGTAARPESPAEAVDSGCFAVAKVEADASEKDDVVGDAKDLKMEPRPRTSRYLLEERCGYPGCVARNTLHRWKGRSVRIKYNAHLCVSHHAREFDFAGRNAAICSRKAYVPKRRVSPSYDDWVSRVERNGSSII